MPPHGGKHLAVLFSTTSVKLVSHGLLHQTQILICLTIQSVQGIAKKSQGFRLPTSMAGCFSSIILLNGCNTAAQGCTGASPRMPLQRGDV